MDDLTFRLNEMEETAPQTAPPAPKPDARASRRVLVIVIAALILAAVVGSLLLRRGAKSKPAVPGETAATSQSSFPIAVPGNQMTDVRPIGGAVCMLSGDALSFVKPNGKIYNTAVLSYVEPVLKTAGTYGLAYDRLSGRYTLFSEKKLLVQSQSETRGQITTACVSASGRYAVACRGDHGAASLLTVYNPAGRVLFSWECGKEHIVSVCIAPDSRRFLCAALGAESGAILTRLYLLDVYSDDVLWSYTLNDAAVIDCGFGEGTNVVAVCGDKRVVINTANSSLAGVFVYPAQLLAYAADAPYGCVIVTEKFGVLDVFEVRMLDNDNNILYVYETEEQPVDIDLHQTRAALLTEHSVLCLNGAGEAKRVSDAAGIELGACLHDARVYHFTAGMLYRS